MVLEHSGGGQADHSRAEYGGLPVRGGQGQIERDFRGPPGKGDAAAAVTVVVDHGLATDLVGADEEPGLPERPQPTGFTHHRAVGEINPLQRLGRGRRARCGIGGGIAADQGTAGQGERAGQDGPAPVHLQAHVTPLGIVRSPHDFLQYEVCSTRWAIQLRWTVLPLESLGVSRPDLEGSPTSRSAQRRPGRNRREPVSIRHPVPPSSGPVAARIPRANR